MAAATLNLVTAYIGEQSSAGVDPGLTRAALALGQALQSDEAAIPAAFAALSDEVAKVPALAVRVLSAQARGAQ